MDERARSIGGVLEIAASAPAGRDPSAVQVPRGGSPGEEDRGARAALPRGWDGGRRTGTQIGGEQA